MKRLSIQQVKDLREVVQASLSRARDLLLKARQPPKDLRGPPKDQKEVLFYEAVIARNEALLSALPERGSVELEDQADDNDNDDDDDDEVDDSEET